jgi:hypothetical protein
MNEVPHSEHVISTSVIAVSPGKRIEGSLSALRSAGVAFLSTTDRGSKAALFSNARQKALASRRVNWGECTPEVRSIQFFYRCERGKVWRMIFNDPLIVARAPQRHIEN